MTRWDLSTGQRRAVALAENFESAFSPMRNDRAWWPSTKKHSARVLIRVRESGPMAAVEDPVTRAWLLRALGEWRATRGGAIPVRGFARRALSSEFTEALSAFEGVSLSTLNVRSEGTGLARLFQALEGIKRSDAQLVAVSKTLYHLLPELVVPFDNEVTCGFFGWHSLPHRVEDAWLSDVYGILASVANSAGPALLDELGRPAWPKDPGVAQALRLGEGRVVDFAMEGYRRSVDAPWYVP